MNIELANVIKLYATKSHKELNAYLIEKSKDVIIALLTDLVTTYINDKNSSTLREFITVVLAGYEHSEGKIGYNGYKQNSILAGKPIQCEAKPKNFDTSQLEKVKSGERKTKPAKLAGNGNFSDYTFKRLARDLKENLNILVSGFVDGKLIYILEFPFSHDAFVAKLKKQLKNKFPNGDKSGMFLRSANFYYGDYTNCKELRILFLLDKKELQEYKTYINNGLCVSDGRKW